MTITAVKGNYFQGQSLKNGYKSLWMNIGQLRVMWISIAKVHRHHILNYMSENVASRKPYIFYNTWNYQERNQAWHGNPYLHEMNKERMLKRLTLPIKWVLMFLWSMPAGLAKQAIGLPVR
jgi:alpha-galactosidase